MNACQVFFNFVVDDVDKTNGRQGTMKFSQRHLPFQGSIPASHKCEVVNHGDGGHYSSTVAYSIKLHVN